MNAAQIANLYARETWWNSPTRTLQDFPGYANLAAYWPLNGNYHDWIGGNHLTPANSPVFAAGLNGWSALDLEAGSTQYANRADNSVLSGADVDFAFACWVNLESKGADRCILAKINSANSSADYHIRFQSSSDRFQFRVYHSGVSNVDVTANNFGSPSLATQYFLFCYHDSVNNLIGISVNDGTVNTATQTGGCNDGTGGFSIGREGDRTGDYWDGLIQQVYFWKGYIPDATERTWLYNAGAGRSLIKPDASHAANLLAQGVWNHA